jgi:hypothetical protein
MEVVYLITQSVILLWKTTNHIPQLNFPYQIKKTKIMANNNSSGGVGFFGLMFLIFILPSCSKKIHSDDYYRSFEYPEQQSWPIFNYFLPEYPQFYWGYNINPYYRIYYPNKNIKKLKKGRY